ncbi:MAG: hypothetical protein ACO3NW_01960 [Kiritimatiellia bacterium]
MKGSPLRDVLLIVMGALLMWLPLRWLTRAPQTTPGIEASPAQPVPSTSDAWLEFRFSQAPESVKVFQEGELLFEGGGALREEADLRLDLSEARNRLQLEFRWPEAVEQAYAELRLEVEERPALQIGFWGNGTLTRYWVLEWEEPL